MPSVYTLHCIDVGAGKFLGANDCWPTFPNLPEKLLCGKKCFHVFFFGEKSQIQTISSVRLIHYTNRTEVLKHLCPNFPGFARIFRVCPDFQRFYLDFRQI